MSRNMDVRKAGLVADVNALALAVAVILLLTSRATFNQAEETISLQGWANMVQFAPQRATVCATLNKKSFTGTILSEISFHCTVGVRNRDATEGPQEKISLPLNGSNARQIGQFITALYVNCSAFAMAVSYNMGGGSAVCYHRESEIFHVLIRLGVVRRHEVGPVRASIDRSKSLDLIIPNNTACVDSFATPKLQAALQSASCYYPANVTDLGRLPKIWAFRQVWEF